jgi:uncharacterized BrkB/YihY/UPF0761 family membrane protein
MIAPVPSNSFARYLQPAVWRSLLAQMSRQRDWMHSAAIAFGIGLALLLGVWAALFAATLNSTWQVWWLSVLNHGLPQAAAPLQAFLQELGSAWSPAQRGGGLALCSVGSVSIWLKVVGLTQHLIRNPGKRGFPLSPSWQARLTTVGLGAIAASLLLLTYGLVFFRVPPIADPVPPLPPRALLTGLRWSLAFSTMALYFGLFFRLSYPSPFTQPLLPGTIVASLSWLLPTLLLKGQVISLSAHHWLYGVFTLPLLGCACLYQMALGLLLGGRFNGLLGHWTAAARSLPLTYPPPPPSLASLTIQRRSPR